MPRWSLVVLAIAAAILAALPFDVIPGAYEVGARWAAAAGIASAAFVAGKQKQAIWCGLFAAMAVIVQPAFPIELKQFTTYVFIGSAIVAAACVVREW